MSPVKLTIAVVASLLMCGCAGPSEAPSTRPAATIPSFINTVWRVSESSAVAPGTLYVFLSDGTLVMTSEHSKPALGTWKYEGGLLTMVEESIPYQVDILNLSGDEFRIRSNNPGGAIEIRLVPAAK